MTDLAARGSAGHGVEEPWRGLDDLTFRAMGTEVRLRGAGAWRVALEVDRLEALLTRFRPSPLTALNDAGRLARPPADLVAALRWACEAARLSGGLVTPLVLGALEAQGYRRSWPDVDAPGVGAAGRSTSAAFVGSGPGASPGGARSSGVPDLRALTVSDDELVLAPGAGIDLGGTGKSWIVERASAAFEGAFVADAGGDVLVRSDVPVEVAVDGTAEPWHVALPPGRWGVATSSVARRAWHGAHHLIDPRTGLPARGPWMQATAVASSLAMAEVATKLVLLDATIPAALGIVGAWAVDARGVVVDALERRAEHGCIEPAAALA